jgi:hypothetical protein
MSSRYTRALFLCLALAGLVVHRADTVRAVSSGVVISQVYGGGGNSGATWKNDFIELFNRGTLSVNLGGMSVQYAATTGSSWQMTLLTNVTLAPGQYYLVQEAAGSGGTVGLPTPDATGGISMASGAGKVALVSGTTLLSGACPGGLVDFVGFGSGTTCFEGTGPTATLTNTTAAIRATGGCTDTDSNPTDFTTGAPTPRNTASPKAPCNGGSTNPSATMTANPTSVNIGDSTTLTLNVAAGTNPPDNNFTVTFDLSAIGLAPQTFTGSGSQFAYVATIPSAVTPGSKSIGATIQDGQNRTGTASTTLMVTQPEPPPPATIKISQVYGGGGNSGATYSNDFIEIFNQGSTAVDISNWSVQYTSSSGSAWQVTNLCAGGTCVVQPGHYYLVQESAGAGGTTALPAADISAGILMSGTNGKVALVAGTTALSGTCPSGGRLVDLVGYGSANCSEAAPTPSLSNTIAAVRRGNGCLDTDNNASDFVTIGPIPRNAGSPAQICGGDPSQPSALGLASPSTIDPAGPTLLTVQVTPATAPPSTGIAVVADLSAIGGGAAEAFYDVGTHGDATAGDNKFWLSTAASATLTTGAKSVVATVTDVEGRSTHPPITLTIQSPTCGVERWPVKVGTDGDAQFVDLENPVATTIAELRALPAPTSEDLLLDNARIVPTERTVFTIHARLWKYKKEDDVDYHVVLLDEDGNTLITEIPSPACVLRAGSPRVLVAGPLSGGIANARTQFDARLSPTDTFQTVDSSVVIPVRVTGVGFFDFIHGQTGVAPNGIELHPVLDFRFTANSTTTLSANVNPAEFGEPATLTALVSDGGSTIPTGRVTFFDGATVVGSAFLNPAGQATLTTSAFSLGAHSLTASYEGDEASAPSTSPVLSLAVRDTTPPAITGVSVTPLVLGPPNHQMIDIAVPYQATDLSGTPVCSVSVGSNEPINGTGDGDTSPDWLVVDLHHVQLRSERAGTGTGRIYTIAISCSDASGNVSASAVDVRVPR